MRARLRRRATGLAMAWLTAIMLAGWPALATTPPLVSGDDRSAAAGAGVASARVCPRDQHLRCGRLRVPWDRQDGGEGYIRLHYQLVPRRDRSRPSLGTIVAVEGGPGYSTTASRAYYRDLFAPLLDRRQLLLVDQRGTGLSAPVRCRKLQSYRGNRQRAVAQCGRQLGMKSDLYGSAIAADDLAAVLDRLHIDKVDLYGDSYGTFFSQAFAVRHPDRLRSLVLDAAYFVAGDDPWYSDTNRALRHAFTIVCTRSPACARRPGRPMQRVAALAEMLRHHRLAGRAPNADGVVRRIEFTQNRLIDLLTGAATAPTIYRELDAAIRAVLRPHPYLRPLLRLGREVLAPGGAGPVRQYSEGMYVAVSCNDYPQPYDVRASFAARRHQYAQSVRGLQRHRPHVFAPFTVDEWVTSGYGYYDDCLTWRRPDRWVHPVPPNRNYPDVPTLVLDGDLDSLTSPEGARDTEAAFPDATFVETSNMTHVSALVDFDQCASLLVRRFVRSRQAGDTSCARDYHENRLVDRFVRSAAQTHWHGRIRRTARVTNATLADVMARWTQMTGCDGVGLRGGHFHCRGGGFASDQPVVTWRLRHVRWVEDVAVTGTMRWHRRSGQVTADVRVRGSGAAAGVLHLRWDDLAPHARAVAKGNLSGHRVVGVRFPSA